MMFISQKLFNGSLVATVIALGQSSSSSSLVCVSTITVRLQGKYRCGTSTWSLYMVLVSTASAPEGSPGSKHFLDTQLSPGTHTGL